MSDPVLRLPEHGAYVPAPSPPRDRRPIAPVRHTIILIAIVLAIAAYGVYSQQAARPTDESGAHRGSALPLYLGLMVGEWALFRYAVVGLRKGGTRMRDLIGGRWTSWRDFARDVSLAAIVWALWTGLGGLLARLLGEQTAKSIEVLLPQGPAEIATSIALSVSAGICEETVFRGYLQKQFEALSGSAAIGLLGQALIFGVAHGYQGVKPVIVITTYGLIFGALAQWRRSLRPGMVMHAWTDIFAGILARRG